MGCSSRGGLSVARSKLSTFISVLSLLVAGGIIVTLFSVPKSRSPGNSRVSATSYLEDDAAGFETPLPIDPARVDYRQTAHFAVDFKKVSAMAVDSDNRIYVAGDKSFCRFSPQGQLETRIALADEPTCMTVANWQHLAPGRIYVGFVDHVEVYGADGAKVAIWPGGLGEKARFTSISTSELEVFIADAGQSVVQRFDWEGKLLEPFGESSPGHFTSLVNGVNAPFDLVVGLDDLVHVVNRRERRVESYTFQGQLERHWGRGSPEVEYFAGASNPAHLALTANSHFVTAEEEPLRVKLYSPKGALEGVVCGPEATGPVVALAADHFDRVLVLDGRDRCVRIFEAKKRNPAAKKS